MKLRHDLLLVTWDDASSLPLGWQMDEEISPKQQIARTIGFCLAKTKAHLVLASTVDDERASTHHFQIPRKMILETQVIAKKGTDFAQST